MRRDILDRGRSVLSVLNQYEKYVKPSFDSYILPTKQHADIIVSGSLLDRNTRQPFSGQQAIFTKQQLTGTNPWAGFLAPDDSSGIGRSH